jgi:phosphatidylglycerophosphate synthase
MTVEDPMKWSEFKAVAHSPQRAAAEFEKGRLWRGVRWLGIRAAYVFYCLRVSANVVSVLAVFYGVMAVAGVIWSAVLPRWAGIVVLACCYGAVFLDFCDGPLARAHGTSGPLGKILDGIGTDFLREGLLVALGVAAGSPTFLLIGLLSGYFIVSVRYQFIWDGIAFDTRADAGVVGRLVRFAFSVVAMLGLLPILIATASFSGLMRPFSRGTLVIYLILWIVWFWSACLRAAKATYGRGADDGDGS